MGPDLHTTMLNALLGRVRQGDREALDELLRRAAARMEALARSMLRRYPRVRRHEQTGDVVQEASLSLLAALKQLHFGSTRELYGLAAEHIRRRLLDLARRYDNPVRSPVPLSAGGEPSAPHVEDGDLERWQALHEAVEALPTDCREAFSLRFYHGWTVAEVAGLMRASTRTVLRLWSRAQLTLSERLGEGGLPSGVGATEP